MENSTDQKKKQAAVRVAPAIRGLFMARSGGVVTHYENEPAVAGPVLKICADPAARIEAVYAELKVEAEKQHIPTVIQLENSGWFVLSPGSAAAGRLAGKIVLVTGAAQGFGEGIARELAVEGARLVIADLNQPRARQVADSINREQKRDAAVSLPVDVGDAVSVSQLIDQIVLRFGGLDLLVSNAGVLRAGSLKTLSAEDFEFVTRVNYTGFFLVSKYGSQPMQIQARFDPDYMADIIQINSKSGLEGSNRNSAYAGGKFGGIGLVQSFAKELVEDRIKVNAICPGNYYEGPLWSDPERGLFMQYLNTGKVPGARTIEDVYQHYVNQVPMRRGCRPVDVARAILYCVEQEYETGQAIPVTGGQVMLR